MKKISTYLTNLFLFTLFLTSCGDKNEVEPDNCNVVKEYLVSQGSRQLLNQYEYDDAGKILKITHQEAAGDPTESRFEYDSNGRLIKIFDKLTIGVGTEPTDGVLEYLYNPDGVLFEIHAKKIQNNQELPAQVYVVYYDINSNLINQVVTSFGDRYRFEYDDRGNATKTFYKPETTPEYLLEEYNAYSEEIQDTELDKPMILRNLFFSPTGRNVSHNQVTSFKVYNEDTSLKATHTINRELNLEGKMVKETSSVVTNGTTSSKTIEKEYPICK